MNVRMSIQKLSRIGIHYFRHATSSYVYVIIIFSEANYNYKDHLAPYNNNLNILVFVTSIKYLHQLSFTKKRNDCNHFMLSVLDKFSLLGKPNTIIKSLIFIERKPTL